MIETHFDKENQLCTATCSGEVTSEELAEYLAKWHNFEYQAYDELFLSSSAFTKISFSDLLAHSQKAAALNSTLKASAKTAIVATDQFTQEMADFYAATQSLKGTRTVMTFLSEAEARQWLDLKR